MRKDAEDGTAAILDWMKQNGEKIDHCLVGEPTSRNGGDDENRRRGSMTAKVMATGVQGHSAYLDRAKIQFSHGKIINILASVNLTQELNTLTSTLAITLLIRVIRHLM